MVQFPLSTVTGSILLSFCSLPSTKRTTSNPSAFPFLKNPFIAPRGVRSVLVARSLSKSMVTVLPLMLISLTPMRLSGLHEKSVFSPSEQPAVRKAARIERRRVTVIRNFFISVPRCTAFRAEVAFQIFRAAHSACPAVVFRSAHLRHLLHGHSDYVFHSQAFKGLEPRKVRIVV